MNHQDFEKAVEETKQEQPYLFDENREPPATDDHIRTIETELGVKLPEEYVWFLKRYGGGLFGYQDIYSALPTSYSFILNSQPFPLPSEKFVAISDNGCGDFYGFRVIDGICGAAVMFCDHEDDYVITAMEEKMENFLNFVALNGLTKHWLWD